MRVVIAEDHDLIREGIVALFAATPEIDIVGEAADGREAVRLVRESAPDLVLMDLAMPMLDGIEATRDIKRHWPKVRILALTVANDERRVAHALRAGVDGYALKKAGRDELLAAMNEVMAGQTYVGAGISQAKVKEYLNADDAKDPNKVLTGRERQVLRMVVEGKTSAEISKSLGISPKTVETH